QPGRVLGPHQSGGEREIEADAEQFEPLPGRPRLDDALLAQIRVAPAGEEVLEVPVALAMAAEDEGSCHRAIRGLSRSKVRPALIAKISLHCIHLAPSARLV